MAIETQRRKFWFGTEEYADWFATPLRGADSSPTGWGVDGTLLSGGGFGFHSWGSHKRYTYEWPESSSPEVAQLMKSYRDGTFGRGLLYFIEPLTYGTNILPALWADPSMAVGDEAPSIVRGVTPEAVPTSGAQTNLLPVTSAYFPNVPDNGSDPTPDVSVFIPVPVGYVLHMGAFYSATGSAGIFVSPVNSNGSLGTRVPLTQLANDSSVVVADTFSGNIKGVRLWTSGPGTLTVAALIARLVPVAAGPSEIARIERGPWVGGQGHSGCRFLGTPSYVTNSPIAGGRIGFAASFIEVGSWIFG